MLQGQLADFSVEGLEVDRLCYRRYAKDAGGFCQQMFLPFNDLVRLYFKVLGQADSRFYHLVWLLVRLWL